MLKLLSNEHKEGYGKPECGVVGGVYAHGTLENILGHDLLAVTNWLSMLPGVRKVTVEDEFGMEHACIAFVWHCGYTTKGLVVLADDNHDVRAAMNRFTEKPIHI